MGRRDNSEFRFGRYGKNSLAHSDTKGLTGMNFNNSLKYTMRETEPTKLESNDGLMNFNHKNGKAYRQLSGSRKSLIETVFHTSRKENH